MNNPELKYYCDDTFYSEDNDKWSFLLDYAFERADAVEFNVLYLKKKFPQEIDSLSCDIIGEGRRKDKIYVSGDYIRYRLSEELKRFIKSKEYKDWKNFDLEDISFLKYDEEFLATITHENYIIIQATEEHRDILNKKGFNFWCQWDIGGK